MKISSLLILSLAIGLLGVAVSAEEQLNERKATKQRMKAMRKALREEKRALKAAKANETEGRQLGRAWFGPVESEEDCENPANFELQTLIKPKTLCENVSHIMSYEHTG